MEILDEWGKVNNFSRAEQKLSKFARCAHTKHLVWPKKFYSHIRQILGAAEVRVSFH